VAWRTREFVRPKLTRATRWQVTLVAAAACLALALALYTSALPSQFKTLNETFFALSLILPYVTLPRPLRRWPPMASVGLLVAVLVGVASSPAQSPVVLLAETVAALILVPLAFDVVDRGILEPTARTVSGLRYCWYAVLVVVPLLVVLLGTEARSGGWLCRRAGVPRAGARGGHRDPARPAVLRRRAGANRRAAAG